MFTIRLVDKDEKEIIDEVVEVHITAFQGFFLSTMNKGFLRALYKSFCEHNSSDLMVAILDDKCVGFVAFSRDTSGIYSYMLRRHFITFTWYSFLAFVRRPSIITKLFSALDMSNSTKRDSHYAKIFSLGVSPECHGLGIGSALIEKMRVNLDFTKYDYITLETDADNNDETNIFYQKNGFRLSQTYTTKEGRKMNKYHFRVHR